MDSVPCPVTVSDRADEFWAKAVGVSPLLSKLPPKIKIKPLKKIKLSPFNQVG
jgi:hypothetical protein